MNKHLAKFLEETHDRDSLNANLAKFLMRKNGNISDASLWHLFRSLRNLSDHLKNPPIANITPRTLSQYRIHLRQKYAPGTMRPIIGDLKQFFRWCKKKGLIEKNPSRKLTKPRSVSTEDKSADETAVAVVIRYLTKQIDRLIYRDIFGILQASRPQRWEYHQLKALHDLFCLVFLYETGGRAGELANLTTKAMTQATFRHKVVYTVVVWGKTDDRQLRFTNATAELWRLWYRLRSDSDFAIYSWKQGGTPQQATTGGISQMLVRRCKQAQTTPFRAHSLRHAKVTRSRAAVGLQVTQKLIDHSDLTATASYDFVGNKELDDAAIKTGLQFDPWQK